MKHVMIVNCIGFYGTTSKHSSKLCWRYVSNLCLNGVFVFNFNSSRSSDKIIIKYFLSIETNSMFLIVDTKSHFQLFLIVETSKIQFSIKATFFPRSHILVNFDTFRNNVDNRIGFRHFYS